MIRPDDKRLRLHPKNAHNPRTVEFYVPVRPYSIVDAHNRRSAALGSPGYAAAAHLAGYNGHRVDVAWNSYRGYYVAEYFWAGRVVVRRGDPASCIRAALTEYDRGAVGASVGVTLRSVDAAAATGFPELVAGAWVGEWESSASTWYTWRHAAAAEAARDAAHPRHQTLIFDLHLLEQAASRLDYEAALVGKYGQARR